MTKTQTDEQHATYVDFLRWRMRELPDQPFTVLTVERVRELEGVAGDAAAVSALAARWLSEDGWDAEAGCWPPDTVPKDPDELSAAIEWRRT